MIQLTLSSEFFAQSFIQTAERHQDNERGHCRQWWPKVCLLSLSKASGPFTANGTMARRVRWLHTGSTLLLCICPCKCCYFVMYCLWENLPKSAISGSFPRYIRMAPNALVFFIRPKCSGKLRKDSIKREAGTFHSHRSSHRGKVSQQPGACQF